MRLLVVSCIAAELEALLGGACDEFGVEAAWCESILKADGGELRGWDLLLADPPRVVERLKEFSSLRWMQSTWAGVDCLCTPDFHSFWKEGRILTALKGVHGPVIADYVLLYIMAFERNLFLHLEDQRDRRWRFRRYRRPCEVTVGFLGTGDIAKDVAWACIDRHGMRVLGCNTDGRPVEPFERVYPSRRAAEMVSVCSYVVVLLPATPDTLGFVSEELLEAMDDDAVLINVGRGSTVDADAVRRALEGGGLRAALLDVFPREPLPADSPLWSAPGCFITPHVAGMTYPDDVARVWKSQMRKYVAGAPLEFVVDPVRGY